MVENSKDNNDEYEQCESATRWVVYVCVAYCVSAIVVLCDVMKCRCAMSSLFNVCFSSQNSLH